MLDFIKALFGRADKPADEGEVELVKSVELTEEQTFVVASLLDDLDVATRRGGREHTAKCALWKQIREYVPEVARFRSNIVTRNSMRYVIKYYPNSPL